MFRINWLNSSKKPDQKNENPLKRPPMTKTNCWEWLAFLDLIIKSTFWLFLFPFAHFLAFWVYWNSKHLNQFHFKLPKSQMHSKYLQPKETSLKLANLAKKKTKGVQLQNWADQATQRRHQNGIQPLWHGWKWYKPIDSFKRVPIALWALAWWKQGQSTQRNSKWHSVPWDLSPKRMKSKGFCLSWTLKAAKRKKTTLRTSISMSSST